MMIIIDLGNSPLPSRTRGKIYNSLVLGILLLYGCESWVLTEMLRAKLEAFHHNQCVRAMCGVTRTRVRSLSGGHEALRQRTFLASPACSCSSLPASCAGQATW